jgi:hypothetical protein
MVDSASYPMDTGDLSVREAELYLQSLIKTKVI